MSNLIFAPSAALWEVLSKLRGIYNSQRPSNPAQRAVYNLVLVQNEDNEWGVDWVLDDYDSYPSPETWTKTAPEAICLAALKACGVEIE